MMNEQTTQYEFKIDGQLSSQWQEWFEGFSLRQSEGNQTLLCGPIRDQAELHGVLKKIRNLGLTLISINPQLVTGE